MISLVSTISILFLKYFTRLNIGRLCDGRRSSLPITIRSKQRRRSANELPFILLGDKWFLQCAVNAEELAGSIDAIRKSSTSVTRDKRQDEHSWTMFSNLLRNGIKRG